MRWKANWTGEESRVRPTDKWSRTQGGVLLGEKSNRFLSHPSSVIHSLSGSTTEREEGPTLNAGQILQQIPLKTYRHSQLIQINSLYSCFT